MLLALSYSCISPLILGFATVGFFLLYLAFRYSALFTLGTTVSTRGQSYARAMKQLTVGIYLSEICLIGLFAIGIAESRVSIGPMIMMIIFLVLTILWQIWLGTFLKDTKHRAVTWTMDDRAAYDALRVHHSLTHCHVFLEYS